MCYVSHLPQSGMSGEPIIIFGSSCLYFHPLFTVYESCYTDATLRASMSGYLVYWAKSADPPLIHTGFAFYIDSLDCQRMNCTNIGDPMALFSFELLFIYSSKIKHTLQKQCGVERPNI